MPHTYSPSDYLEIGKSHYKHEQYEKAIEAFTNAISTSPLPSVTLYDHRAATHEKLGDFNAAVKDGRLAIRTDKKDVRGYLRTGRALGKMERWETAVGVYAYGMRNVEVGGGDFELLQKLHDKLTRRLAPPGASDPFTVLPVELVEGVIGYLGFRNVVNCLRVSKGWKAYLTKRPNLWSNLDFSGATRPVSRKFLRNAVQYSRGGVHTLTVHRIHHTDVLCNIASACKNLETLTILSFPHLISETLITMVQRAQNLKRITVHTEVNYDTLSQVLRARPSWQRFEFTSTRGPSQPHLHIWEGGPFPNLHTLSLRGTFPLTAYIGTLVPETPALRSLTLHGTATAQVFVPEIIDLRNTGLTSLVVSQKTCPWAAVLPATLERVTLDLQLSTRQAREAYRAMTKSSRTEGLTHLTLGRDMPLYPDLMGLLLDSYRDADWVERAIDGAPLQHLSLSGELVVDNHDGTPSALSSVPSSILVSTYLSSSPRILTPALTSLELPGLPLTDEDIEPITGATKLERVDVSGTKISGYGIKLLVDLAPSLRFIRADNCRNVGSRDAVEYAEGKGVRVSYVMGEAGGKGRKVRDVA